MNLLLTVLSSHLLSIIESILAYEEPAIVNALEDEINLLITKLQSYVKAKPQLVAPAVASINSQSQGSAA
jgi:hypothetical protein